MNTFCGANVVVEIEGFPLLETAGIQFSINESKRPIYGYSSRHFDAVARGQVIVQGSIIINYVHQDYLFRAIEQGLIDNGLATGNSVSSINLATELAGQLETVEASSRIGSEITQNYAENVQMAQALKTHWWEQPAASNPSFVSFLPNPHDSFGGMNIRVTFGRRNESTGYLGDTGIYLSDVYFTGRSIPIEITEDVIVEEYPFFARNVSSLRQPYVTVEQPAANTDGNLTGDTVTFLRGNGNRIGP